MIFDAIASDALGLEWEPCHQMVSLIDPLPQLRQWAGKVFHVHGKDATIMWDVIRDTAFAAGRSTFITARRASARPTGPTLSASCG